MRFVAFSFTRQSAPLWKSVHSSAYKTTLPFSVGHVSVQDAISDEMEL